MKKEILKIEFRYHDAPKGVHLSGEYPSKTVTIGIFDTLEEAVNKGNEILATLSKSFEVRSGDKFKINGLFGYPDRLVSNCCYPTNGVQYFAKITTLDFCDLGEVVSETFTAFERWKKYKQDEAGE